MPVPPYVTAMRSYVGHDLILLPSASAVVVDNSGRILLLRRADTGRWSLPAGMVDPGEQPADAAVREIFEETGVHVAVERVAGVANHPASYPNGDQCEYLDVWFRCRPLGGAPRADGDESLAVAWFAPDQLPEIDEWAKLRIETATSGTDQTWFAPVGSTPHPALTCPDAL